MEEIAIVRCLQSASGAISKMRVLQAFKDVENFRKILYYALNPMLTYKISEQTLRTPVEYDPAITITMTDIFEICELLSKRKALDAATVYQVRVFVQCLTDPESSEFYIELLSKTLRLGVTAKTVNKVIPGLIPEWEVQQAYPIDKYPIKEGTEFWLTQKLNGVRATYYKGQLFARSGVPYEGLGHILDALKIDENDSYVFDGELTLRDKGELSDNEAFRKATGIINSEDTDKTAVCYTIFDVLTTEEFDAGVSEGGYGYRRSFLDQLHRFIPQDGRVNILPVLYHGVAKQVRAKYPEVYNAYVGFCNEERNVFGRTQFAQANDGKVIVNMFAQSNYGYDGKLYTDYTAFQSCLKRIKLTVPAGETIAMPFKIGCGLGGGDWNVIFGLIQKELSDKYTVELWRKEV